MTEPQNTETQPVDTPAQPSQPVTVGPDPSQASQPQSASALRQPVEDTDFDHGVNDSDADESLADYDAEEQNPKEETA